jgi:hypothetical protein
MAQGGLPQHISAEDGLVNFFLSLRGELSVSQQKLFFVTKPPAAMHRCIWPERLLFVKQTASDR